MQVIKTAKILLILIFIIFLQGSAFVIDPSKNANWHNEKGLFMLRFGNYYGAVEEFKLAIQLNPDTQASATFYHNLGLTYYRLGVYELSTPCFEKAVHLNPHFIQYHQSLISSYKEQEKLNKVIRDYEKMIEKNPYNSKAHLMLGLIYKKLGNKSKAVAYLSEFKRLEPDLDITKQIDAILKQLR